MASRMPLRALLGLLLVLVVGVVSGQDKVSSSEADINRLTDDVLTGLATYAKNLNSVDLPDVDQNFSTTVLWILSINGNLQLTNGSLSTAKFDKLSRHEASQLTFVGAGPSGELVLRTGVELPEVEIVYDFRAHAGVVTQRGKVTVSVSGLKATTMAVLYMDSLQPYVVDLKIPDLGNIKVRVKDGVVGWLATAVSDLVVGMVKTTLRTAIEDQLPGVINDLLAKLDIADIIKPHMKPTV